MNIAGKEQLKEFKIMTKYSLMPFEIDRFENGKWKAETDLLSVEEPLLIRLISGDEYHESNLTSLDLSVTMRTPGNDRELALGFLFTEGIIRSVEDVSDVIFGDGEVGVEIRNFAGLDLKKLERHFYTTSSCGVCGKASIDAVKLACPIIVPAKTWSVSSELILGLSDSLRKAQDGFEHSGGIHASGLFDLEGRLLDISEDVGRHNALDKLIGRALERGEVPMFERILLLSGRASFELVQKASMAGLRMICAIGAPSSLAVELAEEYHITLVGFLKPNRFNVYTAPERVV